jgi:hypothetical protein
MEKYPLHYKEGDLLVVKYPRQESLAEAYMRLKQEELLQVFFHEDTVERTLLEWLQWAVADPDTLMMGCYRQNPEDPGRLDLCGVGKLGPGHRLGDKGMKSEVAMFFFKEYWDRDLTLGWCRMMIEMIFDSTNRTALFGTIPEGNTPCVRFMMGIGFEHLGRALPHYTLWKGEISGAWIGCMTRQRWAMLSGGTIGAESRLVRDVGTDS